MFFLKWNCGFHGLIINLETKVKISKEILMWQDVINGGSFSSGLDDYPRGHNSTSQGIVYAVHADLQIWMIEFSRFMS